MMWRGDVDKGCDVATWPDMLVAGYALESLTLPVVRLRDPRSGRDDSFAFFNGTLNRHCTAARRVVSIGCCSAHPSRVAP